MIDYYGCVATSECSSCGLSVCPLHFNSTFDVCKNCFVEGKYDKNIQALQDDLEIESSTKKDEGELGKFV